MWHKMASNYDVHSPPELYNIQNKIAQTNGSDELNKSNHLNNSYSSDNEQTQRKYHAHDEGVLDTTLCDKVCH